MSEKFIQNQPNEQKPKRSSALRGAAAAALGILPAQALADAPTTAPLAPEKPSHVEIVDQAAENLEAHAEIIESINNAADTTELIAVFNTILQTHPDTKAFMSLADSISQNPEAAAKSILFILENSDLWPDTEERHTIVTTLLHNAVQQNMFLITNPTVLKHATNVQYEGTLVVQALQNPAGAEENMVESILQNISLTTTIGIIHAITTDWKALQHSGLYLLEQYPAWSQHPDSQETLRTLLQSLTEQHTDIALSDIALERAREIGYEAEFLADMISYYPAAYFENISLFEKETPLFTFAENHPYVALEYFETYKDHDSGENIAAYLLYTLPPDDKLSHFREYIKPHLSPEKATAWEQMQIKNTIFQTSALAYNIEPNYRALAEEAAEIHAIHIDRALVLPLVKGQLFDNQRIGKLFSALEAQTINRIDDDGFGTLREDISTDNLYALLNTHSEQYNGVDPVALERSALLVARHLHETERTVTPENTRAAVAEIIAARESVKDESPISGNVILASHGELMDRDVTQYFQKGDAIFAAQGLLDSIDLQTKTQPGNHTFNHISTIENDATTPESLQKAKAQLLLNIVQNTGETTFYLNGHGSNTAWYFSDGQVQENQQGVYETTGSVKITVEDIVTALEYRYQNQVAAGTEDTLDIKIVMSACSMHDFTKAVLAGLKAKNIPVPKAMVSSAEIGQYGYTDFKTPTGGRFDDLVLDPNTTLESMTREIPAEIDTHPNVFVPDPNDPYNFIQIGGDILQTNHLVQTA